MHVNLTINLVCSETLDMSTKSGVKVRNVRDSILDVPVSRINGF